MYFSSFHTDIQMFRQFNTLLHVLEKVFLFNKINNTKSHRFEGKKYSYNRMFFLYVLVITRKGKVFKSGYE